jgi:hypothetical protein
MKKIDLPEEDTQLLASDRNQPESKPNDSKPHPFVRDAAMVAGGAVAGVAGSYLAHELIVPDSATVTSGNSVTPTTNPAIQSVGPSSSTGNDAVKPEATPAPEQVVLTPADNFHVAHVDNSLSFDDAFADARNQVGPGGVFSYHGHLYNTYYRKEWNNMTLEQKNDYSATVSEHNTPHSDYPEQNIVHEPIHETSFSSDHAEAQISGDEVYILGVGSATIEGHEVYVAQLSMGGDEVFLLDIDKDGTYDYMVADDNSDGKITPDEIVDISQHHITLDQLQEELHPKPDVFAQDPNMPDYTNDADISHFV